MQRFKAHEPGGERITELEVESEIDGMVTGLDVEMTRVKGCPTRSQSYPTRDPGSRSLPGQIVTGHPAGRAIMVPGSWAGPRAP
jgi:hypothetical protein